MDLHVQLIEEDLSTTMATKIKKIIKLLNCEVQVKLIKN